MCSLQLQNLFLWSWEIQSNPAWSYSKYWWKVIFLACCSNHLPVLGFAFLAVWNTKTLLFLRAFFEVLNVAFYILNGVQVSDLVCFAHLLLFTAFSVILLLPLFSLAHRKSILNQFIILLQTFPQNFFVTSPMINLTTHRQLLHWDNCLLWWLIFPCFFVLLIHLSTYLCLPT